MTELMREFFALAQKHQVPGAQLAIYDSGETVAFEVGELQHGAGNRVTRDAAFPIGSISKSFTATTVMTLVADGDIDVDEPVGEYLPELDDLGALVTLRHLLSHTSGLVSDPPTEAASTASLRQYVVDHCRRQNLLLAPGTGFSYSNLGYALVGHLIETITGMSWHDAVESILLRPLAIEPAFIGGTESQPRGRPIAAGHSVNPTVGGIRPVHQFLAPAEAPAGALAVSALDLVALGLVHVGLGVPGLLPATYAEQMRRAVPAAEPFGLADGWGLGLATFRESQTEWVGHDGNADGTSCYLRIDPAGGRVVAFTSNANTGFGMWQELRGELARANIALGRPVSRTSQAQPTAPPSGCVGTYANGDVEYAVTSEQGRLTLAVDGDAFARLTFHGGFAFSLKDPTSGQQVPGGRFLRDPNTGEIDGIQIGGRLARRRVHAAYESGPQLIE